MAELYIFSQDDELLTILSESTGLVEAPFEDQLNRVPDTPFAFTVEAEKEYAQVYEKTGNDVWHLTQVAGMFIGAIFAIEGTTENVFPVQYVVERNRVVFRDREGEYREYVINELDDEDSIDGPLTTATCIPAWQYELQKNYILDKRYSDKKAQLALDDALDGTRYIGEVDADLGKASTNFYHIFSTEAITKILDVWGGEFKDVVELNNKGRINKRIVKIKQRRGGDNGLWLDIDHNIEEIERTLISDPVTAIYGWGASLELEDDEGNKTGGHSKYIGFKDVEWKKSKGDPVDKPKGQSWVGDPDALEKYGLQKDGQLIHLDDEFSNQDYEDEEELLQAAWDHLQKVKDPEINYKLAVDLLGKSAQLGDTAWAIDRNLAREIELQTRIIGIKYDLVNPDDTTEVEMGQFLSLNDGLANEVDDLRNDLDDTRGKAEQGNKPIDDSRFPDIKPDVPGHFEVTGIFKTITLGWDFDASAFIAAYEVYGSQVKGFAPDSSNMLWRGKSGGYVHNADTDQQWYFRVRAVNTHGTASDYTAEKQANTVRIITDDILFGEDMAAELRDLSETADILSKKSIDEINAEPIEYTKTEIKQTRKDLSDRLDGTDGDITAISRTVDEVNGRVSTNIQNIKDMDDTLSSHSTQISQNAEDIELKATSKEVGKIDDRLVEAEGSISVHADEIEAKLDIGNVITGINLSPGDATIQAKKIQLKGDVDIVNGETHITKAAVGELAVADGVIKNFHLGEGIIDYAQMKKAIITDDLVAPNAAIDFAKIANVEITNAMIQNLSASKIKNGILDTQSATVRTKNGKAAITMDGKGFQSIDGSGETRIFVGVRNLAGKGQSDPATMLFYSGNGDKKASIGMNVNDDFIIGSQQSGVSTSIYSDKNMLLYGQRLRVKPNGTDAGEFFEVLSIDNTGGTAREVYLRANGQDKGFIGSKSRKWWHITGNHVYADTFHERSSRDAKENIQDADIADLQSTFDELEIKKFNRKIGDKHTSIKTTTGIIAEDSPADVLDEEQESVALGSALFTVAGSLKYQQRRIDEWTKVTDTHTEDIDWLKKENELLKNRVTKLEAA